jgi:hypothetical protein
LRKESKAAAANTAPKGLDDMTKSVRFIVEEPDAPQQEDEIINFREKNV